MIDTSKYELQTLREYSEKNLELRAELIYKIEQQRMLFIHAIQPYLDQLAIIDASTPLKMLLIPIASKEIKNEHD